MAMRSPLAPAMADIFMNWFIDKAQSQLNCSFSVLCYVNHLFLLFDHHKDIDEIFKISNSTHNNNAFTKELEENNTLPFLDTLIHWANKNINTSCIENQLKLDFILNEIVMYQFSLSKT